MYFKISKICFKNKNVKCFLYTQKVTTNISLKKVRYYSTFAPCSWQADPLLGKETRNKISKYILKNYILIFYSFDTYLI